MSMLVFDMIFEQVKQEEQIVEKGQRQIKNYGINAILRVP